MGDQISDGASVCIRVCRFFACMCMCRMSVCGCVCVCTSTVDNFCVCTACLCPLWKTGKFLAPQSSWCVSFIVYLCVRARVVTLAQVVRLHDSRYSYGVLTCADAWPVWEREAAGVRVFAVKCSTSTVRVSDAPLASTGDVCTMHSMYLSSCGYLVFSGFGIWFLLSVHVCDLFFPRSVPPALQESSFVFCVSDYFSLLVFGVKT